MPLRAVRVAAAAVALLVPVATVTGVAAAPAAHAAGAPGSPTGVSVLETVEGVRVTWQPASFVPGQPTPTGWVVRRGGPAGERTWTLGTLPYPWHLDDDEGAAGVAATYTVSAVAAGVESAPSESVTGAKVPDPRPFDSARDALTVVWEHEDETHRSAAVVGDAGAGVEAVIVAGGVAVVQADHSGTGARLTTPWPIADGAYVVGAEDGAVPVTVEGTVGVCAATSGTLTVARALPSRIGWWAAVTLDADVSCADGARVRAHARLATPEPVTSLQGDRISAIAAAPGTTTVVDHAVRNTGQVPVEVRGVRLLPAGIPTTTNGVDPTGVLSAGLGTCGGVLDPGATCTLRVREDRPAGAPSETEYTTRIVLGTDVGEWTVGAAVGTDRSELAGPQDVRVTGRPGLAVVSWRLGSAQGNASFSLLDASGATLAASPGTQVLGATLPVGTHVLRVRQQLDDGRVYESAPRRAVVPAEWVFVEGPTGVRAVGASADPDVVEGGQVGDREGGTLMSAADLDSSPTRTVGVGLDTYHPRGWLFGVTRVIDTLRPSAFWTTPRFRPDGAVLAVHRPAIAPDGTTTSPAILLRDNTSGATTEVPGSSRWVLQDWTPDGRELLVVPADGAGLFRLDPVSGRTTAVPGAADAGAARVSRNGTLAILAADGFLLYTLPLGGGARTQTSIYAWGRSFAWDRTGTRIAVGSLRYMTTGTGELWDVSGTPRKLRDLPTSRSVTWWDPVSSAPSVSVTVPRWTTATPTLTLTATDADDTVGGLAITCSLDGAAATPCASTWRPGTLTAGTHTATVRVTDPSGATGQRTVTWSVDATAPTASVGALPTAVLGSVVTPTWSSADSGGSGVATYDVRYRRAPVSAGLGAYTYPAGLQGTSLRSTKLTMARGDQYCFSARARDAAGNVGAWSAELCTVSALDDRSLTAGKGWSRGSSSLYLYGTYTRAVSSGASLTLPKVSTRRVGLVVTKCSTCGSVDVLIGSTRLARVSLTASRTAYKQVVWLPTQSATRTGSLTIRTTSSRPAVLDAVLVVH